MMEGEKVSLVSKGYSRCLTGLPKAFYQLGIRDHPTPHLAELRQA